MPTHRGRNPRVEVLPSEVRVRLRPDTADRLALDFCRELDRAKVEYAIVSGYVAILLGRNRLSEGIDLFTEPLPVGRFGKLHRQLSSRFECITPGGIAQLYRDYLSAGNESTSVRYARPGSFAPNIEMKFARKPVHFYSLRRRVPVDVNGQRVYIGAFEMDIAYKVKMAPRRTSPTPAGCTTGRRPCWTGGN